MINFHHCSWMKNKAKMVAFVYVDNILWKYHTVLTVGLIDKK
jgi:hypothetical protein